MSTLSRGDVAVPQPNTVCLVRARLNGHKTRSSIGAATVPASSERSAGGSMRRRRPSHRRCVGGRPGGTAPRCFRAEGADFPSHLIRRRAFMLMQWMSSTITRNHVAMGVRLAAHSDMTAPCREPAPACVGGVAPGRNVEGSMPSVECRTGCCPPPLGIRERLSRCLGYPAPALCLGGRLST